METINRVTAMKGASTGTMYRVPASIILRPIRSSIRSVNPVFGPVASVQCVVHDRLAYLIVIQLDLDSGP